MLSGYTFHQKINSFSLTEEFIVVGGNFKFLAITYSKERHDYPLEDKGIVSSIDNDRKNLFFIGFDNGYILILKIFYNKFIRVEEKAYFNSFNKAIDCLSYHPFLHSFYTASHLDNDIKMWSTKGTFVILLSHKYPCHTKILKINHRTNEMYSALISGEILIWDCVQCKYKNIIRQCQSSIVGLDYDHQNIIVGYKNGEIKLYHPKSYGILKRLNSFARISTICVHKDSLILGTDGGIKKYYELPSLRHYKDDVHHQKSISVIRSDGEKIYSAGLDFTFNIC